MDIENLNQKEKDCTAAPLEITEERYFYYLEVLPPCRWTVVEPRISVFHVSERISGSIVTWCINIGKRYFSVDCSDRLSARQVVDLVRSKFFPVSGVA